MLRGGGVSWLIKQLVNAELNGVLLHDAAVIGIEGVECISAVIVIIVMALIVTPQAMQRVWTVSGCRSIAWPTATINAQARSISPTNIKARILSCWRRSAVR